MKRFYETVNVSTDDFDGCGIGPADLLRNACFVPSLLYQLEDFRADSVDENI